MHAKQSDQINERNEKIHLPKFNKIFTNQFHLFLVLLNKWTENWSERVSDLIDWLIDLLGVFVCVREWFDETNNRRRKRKWWWRWWETKQSFEWPQMKLIYIYLTLKTNDMKVNWSDSNLLRLWCLQSYKKSFIASRI